MHRQVHERSGFMSTRPTGSSFPAFLCGASCRGGLLAGVTDRTFIKQRSAVGTRPPNDLSKSSLQPASCRERTIEAIERNPILACRPVLLLLPASQHFLAGVAELVLLLVQTCDNATAAGRRAGAIFVIVGFAGASSVGGLRNCGSGASDGEHENGEA